MSDPLLLLKYFFPCVRCAHTEPQVCHEITGVLTRALQPPHNCIILCIWRHCFGKIPRFFFVEINSHSFFLPPKSNVNGFFIGELFCVCRRRSLAGSIFSAFDQRTATSI